MYLRHMHTYVGNCNSAYGVIDFTITYLTCKIRLHIQGVEKDNDMVHPKWFL